MTHLIETVEALYPRINQTYRFDNTENRSVPCEPKENLRSTMLVTQSYRLTFV